MSINIDTRRAVIRDLRHVSAQAVFMNDRLTELEASIRTLIAEVEYLRGERADVVAALRRASNHGPMGLSLVNLDSIADAIERGEHRREEGK